MPYFIFLLIYLMPARVYAAFDPKDFSTINNPSGSEGVEILEDISQPTGYAQTLDNVISYMLMIAGGLAFIALVVGAAQYLLAAGDQQKALMGKKTITYAIIGIVVITVLFAILKFVTTGLLKDIIPPPS